MKKKDREKDRLRWLLKMHIDVLRGWYFEMYGEHLGDDKVRVGIDEEHLKRLKDL